MAEIVADMMSSMILVIRAGSVLGRRAEFLVPQAGLGVLPATASRGGASGSFFDWPRAPPAPI